MEVSTVQVWTLFSGQYMHVRRRPPSFTNQLPVDSSLQWAVEAMILLDTSLWTLLQTVVCNGQLVAPCSVAANLQTIGADRVSTVQGQEQLTLSAPIVCRPAATLQGIPKAWCSQLRQWKGVRCNQSQAVLWHLPQAVDLCKLCKPLGSNFYYENAFS